MGLKKSATYSADKERISSYAEILTEAVSVLWFACQICLKFGLRVLPEWRASRLDPDSYNAFDSLIELSGLKVNACFWDDVMAIWVQPHSVTISRAASAGLVVVPAAASNIVLAYMATVTTILLTAVLGVSLLYLVAVNRDKMVYAPEAHLLLCRGLAALRRRKWHKILVKIPLPIYITSLMIAVATAVGSVLFYAVWLVFGALPVVLLAWLSVVLAVAVFGPSAVLPGCILFASIMIIYSTGRIWGLWMKEAYYVLFKKGIRNLIVSKSTMHSSSIDHSVEKPFRGTEVKQLYESRKSALYNMLVFCFGCFAVYQNVWPLCLQFPSVCRWQHNKESANWSYWTLVNSTSCSKHGTGFNQGTAMLSYWIDLQSEELRSTRAANSELLASFTPSYPPLVSWMFLAWSGALSGASGLPYTVLQYVEAIVIGLVVLLIAGLLVHDGVRVCYNTWRRRVLGPQIKETGNRDDSLLIPTDVLEAETGLLDSAPSDRVPVLANVTMDGIGTGPSDPVQWDLGGDHVVPEAEDEHGTPVSVEWAPTPPTAKDADVAEPHCLCEALGLTWLLVLAAHCPLACGVVLPFSVVGLFLPEECQLPGILLLLTAYTVWIYRKLVTFVWQTWFAMQSIQAKMKEPCDDCGDNPSFE
ncbi:uncharacterized protein LOC129583003 isoform X2 [Paramacrobiotus metropolitanus]|uniref:uncharacterized protein LOC129583003 isoform X2 n=1 Tax=Paramacrobiotus metropolitanus TaxID=2943436 RepID=UPI0024463672|nr:uncharacterized protein LOC129583003 isoform X2 [Paramacrobiotus metropolitanus]